MDTIEVTTAGNVSTLVWEWTSDGSGNASGRTAETVPGVLFACATTPGTGGSTPSANYDIDVKQAFAAIGGGVNALAADLAGGDLHNRSAASLELAAFWPVTVQVVSGLIQIAVTNAGANKRGRIELQVARFLGVKRGEVQLPLTGGAAGQIAQYDAPGAGKWVEVSGEASIADGGEVTLQGSPVFDAVTVTGNTHSATGTFTGAVSAASAAISGALTAASAAISGVLSATGLVTLTGGLSVEGGNTTVLQRIADGFSAVLNLYTYRNSGAGSQFVGYAARGTKASPAVSQTGDNTVLLSGQGHSGSGFIECGRVQVLVGAGTPGASSMPGVIEFLTTPDGATSLVSRAEIQPNGTWLVKSGKVVLSSLPTSSSGLAAGSLWNDGGTVKIA